MKCIKEMFTKKRNYLKENDSLAVKNMAQVNNQQNVNILGKQEKKYFHMMCKHTHLCEIMQKNLSV